MSQVPSTVYRPELITGPAAEPVTLSEAKKHQEIGAGTTHDVQLAALIEAARQQWERDTERYLIQRTMRWTLGALREVQFPHRPVSAISSIAYYDGNNTQQTLSTSLYQLDAPNNSLRRSYRAVWPATLGRWDAVQINYTLGSYADSTEVDAISKQAMLLWIGYHFEQRGDNDRPNDMRAYESLVLRHKRSSYP